jgi:site-specific DNA-methyltransferase (adenine-specific)
VQWTKTNPTPHQYDRRLISAHEPFFHYVKTGSYQYYLDAVRDQVELAPKPDTKLGSKYFKLIEESALTDDEKAEARIAVQAAQDDVRAGKLFGFRMKIRGIHKLAYGGQEGGRNNQIKNNGFTIIRLTGKSIARDVIECPVDTPDNAHTAVFPQEIVEYFIKLTTQENDVVLDPFMGSGTVALACKKLNRRFIGFEICERYVDLAKSRIFN